MTIESYMDAQNLVKQWRTLFEAVNDKAAPVVGWSRGWFTIDGKYRHRRGQLEAMCEELRRRQKEQKND